MFFSLELTIILFFFVHRFFTFEIQWLFASLLREQMQNSLTLTSFVCVCVCGWNRWYSRIFGIKQWLIFPLLPFGDYCYENGNNLLEAKRTVKRQFIKGTTVEQPNYLFVFGMEQLKPLRLLGWELIHFWLKCERIYLIWRRIDIVRKCIYIASQEKRFKDY